MPSSKHKKGRTTDRKKMGGPSDSEADSADATVSSHDRKASRKQKKDRKSGKQRSQRKKKKRRGRDGYTTSEDARERSRQRRQSSRSRSRRRRDSSDDSSRDHRRKRRRYDDTSSSRDRSRRRRSPQRRRGRDYSSPRRRDNHRRYDESVDRYRHDLHDRRRRRHSRSRRRSFSSYRDRSRHRRRSTRRRDDRRRRSRSWSHEDSRERYERYRVDRRRRPPRHDENHHAGVVSDDDDGNHYQHHAEGTTEAVAKSPSDHDDSIGHYNGQKGAVIADRYRVIKEVGVGTFGRVLQCRDLNHRHRDARGQDVVAIKVVRDVKRYHESAIIEAGIIQDVNRRGGRGLTHCAVMYDAFSHHGHYCMVFESLGPSLYDFLKRHEYQPFPVSYVRDYSQQLLETLDFLHSNKIIHTDLKLENLLLLDNREVKNRSGQIVPESNRIKVIDFGGATYDYEKKGKIINTRQYRATEVILGCGWSMPSDLWSLGCILTELYQGELLFPTHDNIEHLGLIEKTIGPFPRRMLNRAKNTDLVNDAFDSSGKHRMDHVLSTESLSFVQSAEPLESIVSKKDKWFLHLLRRILVIDPDQRATARQCLQQL